MIDTKKAQFSNSPVNTGTGTYEVRAQLLLTETMTVDDLAMKNSANQSKVMDGIKTILRERLRQRALGELVSPILLMSTIALKYAPPAESHAVMATHQTLRKLLAGEATIPSQPKPLIWKAIGFPCCMCLNRWITKRPNTWCSTSRQNLVFRRKNFQR